MKSKKEKEEIIEEATEAESVKEAAEDAPNEMNEDTEIHDTEEVVEEKEASKSATVSRKSRSEKLSKWGNKGVTRKFLAFALAGAVLLNAGITTAGMAHYSKKYPSNARGSDRPGNEEIYGGGRGGRGGMMPPDMNGDFGNSPRGRNNQGNSNNFNNEQDGSGQNQQNQQQSGPSIGIVIREESGVYVSQVTGEKAKTAGFKEGDKIVSLDGKAISNSNDLISEIKTHKAGDTVTMKLERNGQEVEIKTELE